MKKKIFLTIKTSILIKLFLLPVIHLVFLPTVSLAQLAHLDFEDYKLTTLLYEQEEDGDKKFFYDTYMYQNQDMKSVSWLYAGFVPRMEDPNRVGVFLSKKGYSMRVSMSLTKEEVAKYPYILVKKAKDIEEIMNNFQAKVYPESRNQQQFQSYFDKINEVTDSLAGREYQYSEEQYQLGLSWLMAFYPENIFEMEYAHHLNASDISVTAHFVYPITIHKGGFNLPPDGVYIQAKEYFSSQDAINERRTEHYERKGGKRVLKDHIFSGFPAFWISSKGAGIGVHGPIRYSLKEQSSSHQSGPYGKSSEGMGRFWSENEFLTKPMLPPVDEFSPIQSRMRWDLVRTNDSQGCFRAETMELRHLLPSNPEVIFRSIKWTVMTEVDQVRLQSYEESKKVDVNYYMVSPYKFPLSRDSWISERILGLNQRLSPEVISQKVEQWKNGAILFPYLDPSTVEIILPPSSRNPGMEKLNQL